MYGGKWPESRTAGGGSGDRGEEEQPDAELKCPSRQRLAGFAGHCRFGGENRVYSVSGGKFSDARKKNCGSGTFLIAGLSRSSSRGPYRAVIS